MKNLLLSSVVALVAAGSLFADNWVYDPNGEIDYLNYKGGVVSDGVWKFKATVSGSTIKFGAVATNVYPEVVTPIDFSKPVEKAGDPSTTYTITELNDGFGFYRNGKIIPEWGYPKAGWDSVGWRPCCYQVGEVRFPEDGLTKIGDRFFTHCTNLTTVTEKLILPASLTSIGTDVFLSCTKIEVDVGDLPSGLTAIGGATFAGGFTVTGDLKLPNIKTIGGSAFKGTAITSASMGPDLTKISGGYDAGAFDKCTSLTNFTIDAAANAQLDGGWLLSGSPKIQTTLDLSGVGKVTLQSNNRSYPMFYDCAAKKYIFSSKLTTLYSYSFHNCNAVNEVHFAGMPPTFTGDKVFLGANQTGLIATYVHLDENDPKYADQKAAWDALTEGGELLAAGSTWKSSMVDVDASMRILLLYKEKEKGELGHWIYDDRCSPAVVSNGLFVFKAVTAASTLTFGEFVSVPSEPAELDFTKRITDYEGVAYTLAGIDTKFGGLSGGNFTTSYGKPGAEMVSRIVLPATNELFTSIGEFAFCGCVNCEEVVNCIPDSVTVLGKGAFALVKMSTGKTDIRLYGISYVNRGLFWKVPVTSVVFGPTMKGMNCSWNDMAFQDNSHLTNVTFDAAMCDVVWDGSTYGPFAGCNNIKYLDLSGFKSFGDKNWGGATGVGEVVFGTNLVTVVNTFFGGMTGLTNIVFNCPPPTGMGMPFLGSAPLDNRLITTTVPKVWRKVKNANGKSWLDYAADNDIGRKRSTWAAEYIREGVSLDKRLLVSPDYVIGMRMIVR